MNKVKVETIIFDLAEVIIKGIIGLEDRIAKARNINKKPIRISLLSNNKLTLLFLGKITEEEFWCRVLQDNPELSNVGSIDFLKRVTREHFEVVPDMITLIRKLRDAGYQLGLLSDHCLEWIVYYDIHFPLKQLFHVRCFSYEIGYTKQSLDSFNTILSRLQANPFATLFVDDRYDNCEVAKLAGIKYVHQFENAAKLRLALLDLGITID